jgi:hypothetical protein
MKRFTWRSPEFWQIILLLLILGSVWATFIKTIDWLSAIATR